MKNHDNVVKALLLAQPALEKCSRRLHPRSVQDAEDLVQDVSEKILKNFGRYDKPIDELVAMAVTTMKNLFVDKFRKNSKHKVFLIANFLYDMPDEQYEEPENRKELVPMLDHIEKNLNHPMMRTFVHFVNGKTGSDISRMYGGMNINTITGHCLKTRKALKKKFDPRYVETPRKKYYYEPKQKNTKYETVDI